MDYEDRYGDLTDEYEQMASAEAAVPDGTIIVCGTRMKELIDEMLCYLVTRN